MSFFLSAFGLMMILEGLPCFCSPNSIKEFAKKIPAIPEKTLQIMGLILMLTGLGFVYIGREIV